MSLEANRLSLTWLDSLDIACNNDRLQDQKKPGVLDRRAAACLQE